LTAGQVVIEGKNDVRLDGLDLGGSNFNSIVPFVLQQDSSNLLEYEAADMRLYGLGLLEASVDTYANASTALDAMDLAMNKATAERTKLGAIGRRFGYAMDTHRQYIADSKDIESQIRNVDLAEESSFLASSQMKYNAAISMVTQHNEALQSLLMLLQ
jgi:flagellin